jgi:Transmembrane protein 43
MSQPGNGSAAGGQRPAMWRTALGVGLVLIAVPLVFVNEMKTVRGERSLGEGASSVKTTSADAIDSALDGRLVHVTGEAKSAEPVIDPDLRVSVPGLRLDRHVEMFQWKETSHSTTVKKNGSTRTSTYYTYSRDWSEPPIDSHAFHEPGHTNPAMKYSSAHFVSSSAKLGAFTVGAAVIDKLEPTPVALGEAERHELPAALSAHLDATTSSVFLGADPKDPELGDLRVRYEVVLAGVVTVIGAQHGSELGPWQAPSGESLLMVKPGAHASAELFKASQSDNDTTATVLRLLLWGMLFFGLKLAHARFAERESPRFALASMAAGPTLFAAGVASSVAFFVWGLSRLTFRPGNAILLMALAAGIAFALDRYGRRRSLRASSDLGLALHHIVIERQDPSTSVVSLAATDSVLKGKFKIQATRPATITSMKAEFVVQLASGKQIVLGADVFPAPYTSRSSDMVQYPFTIHAGDVVEDFFTISIHDEGSNTDRSVASALERLSIEPVGASLFVRTTLAVSGTPARPEAKSQIQLT